MRLGRIGYVNCFPVYGAMDRGIVAAPATLVTGTPNELNDRLADGRLEVSVISAVAYAQNSHTLALLPDLAISSDGPVRSVLLCSRVPVGELDGARVLVSSSSRTSVHLLGLLAADHWNVRLDLAPAPAEPHDLARLQRTAHEAVLVIGDAALLLRAHGSYRHIVDLGEAWKRWTGLPFVFALWAARRDADPAAVRAVHRALLASRRWGLANLGILADQAARQTGVDEGDCAEYLAGLDYGLSYRHQAGLTDFLRRLAARGAIPDGSLDFVSAA
ncbi:MAG TPA: menaquinone biosynthesis protein [Gemmatimonadales bacterium]|nr:menaquinone biosynthesis protein [Gemmatimonadales bacterium]